MFARAVRRPRWRRPVLAVALAIAVMAAAGYGMRWGITAYRASLTVTGLSDDPTPVQLIVGGETIVVPGNMLREPAARAGGGAKQVELVLHWPTLNGYTPLLADDFIDGSPAAPLVYATVATRSIGLDPEARLASLYSGRFIGAPLPAPDGLTARRLSSESGYGGEAVYYAAPGDNRFVARCLADPPPDIPATCLRDVNVGSKLTLVYRFNRDIIAGWAALDAGMRALAATMARP